MNKWMEAADAVEQIFDGATIALASNGGGVLEPDAVLAKLEQRFLETWHPRDLTVIHAFGIGDGQGSGLGRLTHLADTGVGHPRCSAWRKTRPSKPTVSRRV
ncbi:Acetyl-CoA:acetoacetyl-CoA transferase, alpha subunit [Candidatus Burkholderia brachyanthoides]|nr:Acetyl-CoA:acetoacetyl-CoA transferase, alpha subunit [Candidatus Burkholderia brachyanthoides]